GMNLRHLKCRQQPRLPEASASYRVSRSPKPSMMRYLTRKAAHGTATCPHKLTRCAHKENVCDALRRATWGTQRPGQIESKRTSVPQSYDRGRHRCARVRQQV